MMKFKNLNFLPNENQKLLLTAALVKAELAVTAWEDWVKQVDINDIDNASYQLIPKIYKNLSAISKDFSHYEIIKGIYKHNWVNNQLLFSEFAQLMKEWPLFKSTKVILLKGSVMMANYYRDLGVRVLGDIDVLLPKEQLNSFHAYLLSCGFTTPTILSSDGSIATGCFRPHAISFARKRGLKLNPLNIDVHYMPLYEISFMEDQALSWFEHINPVAINNLNLWGLDSTHLLFQTCVHGLRYYQVPALRWILDSVTLIEQDSHTIDWEFIIDRARVYNLITPMRVAFNFLLENFPLKIPDNFLRKLNSVRVSALDKWDFYHKSSQENTGLINIFLALWLHSQRQEIGFISCLKRVYHVQSIPSLVWILFKKAAKRFFAPIKRLISLYLFSFKIKT